MLLRDSIRRTLEAEGHRIARACDGQQAAAAIREESFDLLIIDVLFPGIRTLEAVIEWSREPNRGRILGLSRFARILPKYYLSLTRKLGMEVILAKPFEPAQLTEAIGQVFADPARRASSWRGDESSAVA